MMRLAGVWATRNANELFLGVPANSRKRAGQSVQAAAEQADHYTFVEMTLGGPSKVQPIMANTNGR